MTPVPCEVGVTVRDFGVAKVRELTMDAAAALAAAARSPKPEPVHRMRVSIRRLQQAVRLFRQFLREKGVRLLRRDLRSVMEPAGELRNVDIACSLVRRAGGDVSALRERRVAARAALLASLSAIAQEDIASRWLRQLDIANEEAQTLEG